MALKNTCHTFDHHESFWHVQNHRNPSAILGMFTLKLGPPGPHKTELHWCPYRHKILTTFVMVRWLAQHRKSVYMHHHGVKNQHNGPPRFWSKWSQRIFILIRLFMQNLVSMLFHFPPECSVWTDCSLQLHRRQQPDLGCRWRPAAGVPAYAFPPREARERKRQPASRQHLRQLIAVMVSFCFKARLTGVTVLFQGVKAFTGLQGVY